MTDYFATAAAWPRTAPPPAPPAPVAARGRPWRRLVAGGTVVVVLAGAAWWWTGRPPAELRLPTSLAGLPQAPAEQDFGVSPAWVRDVASTAGFPVAGRGYRGPAGTRPLLLNAVVMGGDGGGELDIGLAAPGSVQELGDVRCTQTLDLSAVSGAAPPEENPSMVLCWRTSRRLSVSVLVLGTDPSYVPTAAAAVRELWDVQG